MASKEYEISLTERKIICSDSFYKKAQKIGTPEAKELAMIADTYKSFTIVKKRATSGKTEKRYSLKKEFMLDYVKNSTDKEAKDKFNKEYKEKMNFFKLKSRFRDCFPNFLQEENENL